MADKTRIAWADATINPAYGCSKISPACDHCYAAAQAPRLGALTEGTVKNGNWTGKFNLFPGRMKQARAWKRPRRIFIGSMTDIFHENVPDAFLDEVFGHMALAYWHTFLLLTKRPDRMHQYLSRRYMPGAIGDAVVRIGEKEGSPLYLPKPVIPWPFPNVWLGCTVENQDMAEKRIPDLLACPAALHFISAEPLLGGLDLGKWLAPPFESGVMHMGMNEVVAGDPLLGWVIGGAESGRNARPWCPDWARSLRDQCKDAGVPFMWKQNGEWAPYDRATGIIPTKENGHSWGTIDVDGNFFPSTTAWTGDNGETEFAMVRVGKERAGHLLDGVEHMEFPE